MTYRDMYEEVVASGKYQGRTNKLKKLAQLMYKNNPDNSYESEEKKKQDSVWQALEGYEDMTGYYFDPTQDEFDEILSAVF